MLLNDPKKPIDGEQPEEQGNFIDDPAGPESPTSDPGSNNPPPPKDPQ